VRRLAVCNKQIERISDPITSGHLFAQYGISKDVAWRLWRSGTIRGQWYKQRLVFSRGDIERLAAKRKPG